MHRLALLTLLLTAANAHAAPAIQPGDIGLRHDIQVLADYGVIRGPVSTWPLSWDAIVTDLRTARDEDMILPVAVEQTLQRLLARANRETQRGQHRFHGRLTAAEEPSRIRSFENTPREDAELAMGYSWFGEHLSIDLRVTGVDEPDDGKDVRPDGSQIALDLAT